MAVSGDKMSLLRIHDIDLYIKGKTFTNQVTVISKLNNKAINIDFTN